MPSSPIDKSTPPHALVEQFVERCAEIRHGSPNAFYRHVDEFCRAFTLSLPARPAEQAVNAFIRWVKRTPHGSLVGDSRVAYEAQVRVLEQLQWYLQGGDEALNAYVTDAARPTDMTRAKDRKPVCRWAYDETSDAWDTGCDEKFVFIDGGPSENGAKFCFYCGKPLIEKKEQA